MILFPNSTSIIRDLTLRSADSFGSYHMLRLLFDEYLNYLIEHKIAAECRLSRLEAMSCKETFSLIKDVDLSQ